MINIALDGPSGAGKSTLAKALAAKLGYIYTDTGAMYRTIGLAAKRAGVSPEDKNGVIRLLPLIKISLGFENGEQKIYLNGEDVGGLIRTNEISAYASKVSAIPQVRAHLLSLQRTIAAENNVIMDGRDIGTVILPNAQVKIFLTASNEARARRRCIELVEKGMPVSYEEILADMNRRDEADRTRAVAPAVPADDAVIFDNSDMDFDTSVSGLLKLIKNTAAEKGIVLS